MKQLPLIKEALVSTLLVLLTFFIVSFFPFKSELVKPIKQELGDFDIYDMHFSGKTHYNHQRDTNIVIVQVGEDRGEIARQIQQLSIYQPAAIGLDVEFAQHGEESFFDEALEREIKDNPLVVTGYRLAEQHGHRELYPSLNFFDNETTLKKAGYFNFKAEEVAVVRNFYPFYKLDSTVVPAFSSRILERYAPAVYEKLKKRKGLYKTMPINYTGNMETYTTISRNMLMDDSTGQLADVIRGRIVLLGVVYAFGPAIEEDLHFTPLNDRMTGKSYPDMYGVLIHANVLSMMLSEKYIRLLPRWINFLLAGLISFVFIWFQLKIAMKKKHVAHWKLILIQLGSVFLLVYICLLIFSKWRIKIELLPLIIAIVVSVELFGSYHKLSKWIIQKTSPWFRKPVKKIVKK